MKLFAFFVPLVLITATSINPVQAQPLSDTRYAYYSVSGHNLQQLSRNIVRNGPSAGGVRGYGVTTAIPGGQMSAASCKKNGGFRMDIDFVISLPKAISTAKMSTRDNRAWFTFTRFVKKHEETHRTIWLNCAAKFEQQLRSVNDCDYTKVQTIWNKMLASCQPLHVKFDKGQRSVLRSQSFIKLAKN